MVILYIQLQDDPQVEYKIKDNGVHIKGRRHPENSENSEKSRESEKIYRKSEFSEYSETLNYFIMNFLQFEAQISNNIFYLPQHYSLPALMDQ